MKEKDCIQKIGYVVSVEEKKDRNGDAFLLKEINYP